MTKNFLLWKSVKLEISINLNDWKNASYKGN